MKIVIQLIKKIFILLDILVININKIKLNIFGVNFGKKLIFTGNFGDISNILLVNPEGLKIGNNVFIGKNFYCNSINGVNIGDNVMISHNVSIISANHLIENGEILSNKYEKNKEINIGEGSWIGIGVIILPGIKIGKKTIIGAGTVVTKDVEDFGICVGNPGKLIKKNYEISSNINTKLE